MKLDLTKLHAACAANTAATQALLDNSAGHVAAASQAEADLAAAQAALDALASEVQQQAEAIAKFNADHEPPKAA